MSPRTCLPLAPTCRSRSGSYTAGGDNGHRRQERAHGLGALDEQLRWCDQQVGLHVRASPEARRAAKLTGIGEIGASALTASVGDFKQFKTAHQFGAWLGLVPRPKVRHQPADFCESRSSVPLKSTT